MRDPQSARPPPEDDDDEMEIVGEEAFVRRLTEEMAEFLRAHPDIDAVVLSSDTIAGQFYRAAARLGRRIPEDISVVGFNNSYVASALTPGLSSLFIDRFEYGRRAIHLLNEFINGNYENAFPAKATYTMVHRESI